MIRNIEISIKRKINLKKYPNYLEKFNYKNKFNINEIYVNYFNKFNLFIIKNKYKLILLILFFIIFKIYLKK